MLPRPPSSTLFPYTTLFRSHGSPLRTFAGQAALRSRKLAPARREVADRLHSAPGRDDGDGPVCTPEKAEHHHCTSDRKSTRLNSSHMSISYAVFCLKKKKKN